MFANAWSSFVGFIWGLIVFAVFLSVFGASIWAFAQWVQYFSQNNNKDALAIAKERYAKGEITKEELAEIKKNIS